MSIAEHANEVAGEILQMVEAGNKDQGKIAKIIEAHILEVVKHTHQEYKSAVNICCSADEDMAHKLAHEFRQKRENLIANLSSLR